MNEQNNNQQPQQNSISPNTTPNMMPNQTGQVGQNPNFVTSNNISNTQTEVLQPTYNNQINQVTTPNITPNVNTVTQTPPSNQIIGQQPIQQPEEPTKEKGGCFKQILLFTFLIALVLFVFFLPEISSFMQNRKTKVTGEEVRSGTLSCTMEQESDTSDLTYQAKFNYIDNKLKTSTLTLTIQDESDANIMERYTTCQNVSNISKTLTGIDTECRQSENMLIITENYEHETIDKNNLTKFTEAGGTYPEFNYQDDVNKIKAKMKKNGYDCKEE